MCLHKDSVGKVPNTYMMQLEPFFYPCSWTQYSFSQSTLVIPASWSLEPKQNIKNNMNSVF